MSISLFAGISYHEKCDCPQPQMSQWLKDMGCPGNYKQIKYDLSLFRSIDMEVVAEEAVSRFNQKGRHSLCHYVVKDNKVNIALEKYVAAILENSSVSFICKCFGRSGMGVRAVGKSFSGLYLRNCIGIGS